MEAISYGQAERFARSLPREEALAILDVGSLDVNGTVRPLFERAPWTYTGLDLRPGPNVDHVAEAPYAWALPYESFDVVVCLSTLEHSEAPWLLVGEMARVLKPGGILYCSVPHTWAFHAHPDDFWRILPAGMKALFRLAGLETMDVWTTSGLSMIGTAPGDTFGTARKPPR